MLLTIYLLSMIIPMCIAYGFLRLYYGPVSKATERKIFRGVVAEDKKKLCAKGFAVLLFVSVVPVLNTAASVFAIVIVIMSRYFRNVKH